MIQKKFLWILYSDTLEGNISKFREKIRIFFSGLGGLKLPNCIAKFCSFNSMFSQSTKIFELNDYQWSSCLPDSELYICHTSLELSVTTLVFVPEINIRKSWHHFSNILTKIIISDHKVAKSRISLANIRKLKGIPRFLNSYSGSL